MRLKVWEPFRGFKPFYSDVDRLINEFGQGSSPWRSNRRSILVPQGRHLRN